MLIRKIKSLPNEVVTIVHKIEKTGKEIKESYSLYIPGEKIANISGDIEELFDKYEKLKGNLIRKEAPASRAVELPYQG